MQGQTAEETPDGGTGQDRPDSARRRRAAVAERPRPRVDFRGLFGLAAGGWPWSVALTAAVAMGTTFALASWLSSPSAGVLAALGSFTVLYERTTPYAHRAVALALVGLGFVGCVAAGSLTATLSVWAAAAAVGAVAGVATWVCQSLRVGRPAAFMFILVCAIATIMPGGAAEVPVHAGLAAFGAAVGWLGGMAGAVLRRHGPEERAVSAAFRQLAGLLRAVGTPGQDHAQHEASVAVAEAWRIVLLAQIRGYRDTAEAARLRALLRWVSDTQLTATDVALARHEPLAEEVPAFAARLAAAVARPELAPDPDELDHARRGHRPRSPIARLYSGLARAAQAARRAEHQTEGQGTRLHDSRRPQFLDALRSGLGRGSLIGPTALRMAITVAAAGLLGLALGMERFYWLSITAAAVLQGGNVVLTANRSLQRSLGTALGVLIGAAILAQQPPIAVLVVTAAALQGLAQLFMPRNFLYASFLLTPMALVLANTAQPTPIEQLAQARVLDTLLGSAIGILGAVLLWRSASAARLPQFITESLERSKAAVAAVLDPEVAISPERRYSLRRDLRAALLSLRGVYDSAIGDVPRPKSTRPLWPVVVATQRVGFQALAALAREQAPQSSYITVQRVDLAFDELGSALAEHRVPRLGALPTLPHYPRLPLELRALSAAMRTAVAEDEHLATEEREKRERRERRHAEREIDADL